MYMYTMAAQVARVLSSIYHADLEQCISLFAWVHGVL